MYSGQEIVSQEKCRLLLANFYEGINCIDYKSTAYDNPVINMTLQDSQTAQYDPVTLTLTTVNFSVRPLILDSDADYSYIFLAEVPAGTTGLEVIMFAEEYRKVRIMPLYLIRTCNSYTWSWTLPPTQKVPDPFDWSYLTSVCYKEEENQTILEYSGEVDTISRSAMTFVGNEFVEPTVIELFFHDGVVPFSNASHETWIEYTDVINPETGQVVEVVEHKRGRVTVPQQSDYISVVGAYSIKYPIRPCYLLNDPREYENLKFCYDSETQSTKLEFNTLELAPDLLPDKDGWYYVGNLRVRPV